MSDDLFPLNFPRNSKNLLAKLAPDLEVFAIEPDATLRALLHRNREANAAWNVHVVEPGWGAADLAATAEALNQRRAKLGKGQGDSPVLCFLLALKMTAARLEAGGAGPAPWCGASGFTLPE